MRAFCWLLAVTAAAIGPVWHGTQVAGQVDPQLFQWVQRSYEGGHGGPLVRGSEKEPQLTATQSPSAYESQALSNMAEISTSNGSTCPAMSVERNGTCLPLVRMAETRRARQWERTIPVLLSIDDRVEHALKSGRLCENIPADACVNNTRRVSSDRWRDPWWSWLEFYGGRVSCADEDIRQNGDCIFGSRDGSRASCFMRFFKIRTSYRWRVAVGNTHHDEPPLAVIEAGNTSATAKVVQATLQIRKDPEDHFHIVALDLGRVRIKNLVVENSTISWDGKRIDTMERRFRGLIRSALSNLACDFIGNNYLDHLKKAFVEGQD